MKKSEARIIIYLLNVSEDKKFISKIATKLDMDYQYTIHLVFGMVEKEWITKRSYDGKTHCTLTSQAPMKEAKEILK